MKKDIHLYNSLTNSKEIFKPLVPGNVGIYVCGPTVYSSSHMGHARSAIVFDVIVRFLRQIGFKVNYVKNFTDIDDKIIEKANELNQKSEDIANKYKQEYIEDMKNLGCISPDHEPCVSQNINGIIDLIKEIIDKDFAYEINGDVYFQIDKFKEYGKLSNQSTDSMIENNRIEFNPNKKNPLDFALWKKVKNNEPSWESPWGNGRPGWHIECSVMSCKHLGKNFDIHGGGRDLIFPHHENEIAQSECINSGNFANYWIHNGLININKEKMSKSLGNMINIKDALTRWHPILIRIFFLSHHYRTPVDLSEEKLIEIEKSLKKAKNKIMLSKPKSIDLTDFNNLWMEAMHDDFNTAKAIGIFFKYINDGKINPSNIHQVKIFEQVMGITNWTSIFEHDSETSNIDSSFINNLISKRNEARKNKNWELADELRNEAEQKGFILIDEKEQTLWKTKDR